MEGFKLNVKLTKKEGTGKFLNTRFKVGNEIYVVDRYEPGDNRISFYQENKPTQRHNAYCNDDEFMRYTDGGGWQILSTVESQKV